MTYYMKTMPSPTGKIKLVASDKGLAAILWENDRSKRVRLDPIMEVDDHPILNKTEKQLTQYFNGELETFDLPLDFIGTEFQKKVWKALLTIPFGQTRTYSQIAKQIGKPRPCAPWVQPTAATRSPSSRPATGLSVPTVR